MSLRVLSGRSPSCLVEVYLAHTKECSSRSDVIELVEMTSDGVWEWFPTLQYEFMSERFWSILGYDHKVMPNSPDGECEKKQESAGQPNAHEIIAPPFMKEGYLYLGGGRRVCGGLLRKWYHSISRFFWRRTSAPTKCSTRMICDVTIACCVWEEFVQGTQGCGASFSGAPVPPCYAEYVDDGSGETTRVRVRYFFCSQPAGWRHTGIAGTTVQ